MIVHSIIILNFAVLPFPININTHCAMKSTWLDQQARIKFIRLRNLVLLRMSSARGGRGWYGAICGGIRY